MGWNLPNREHKTYERNPLVVVVAQLRFHPVLKVPDRVADFQERVRARFPTFAEVATREIAVRPSGLDVKEGREFRFDKLDAPSTISLGDSALALETRSHTSHRSFLDDMALAVQALVDVFSPVVPTRLGLRYINAVDRSLVAQALGREVSWPELIVPGFLTMPESIADLQGTYFAHELNSRMQSGEMTLRYGLMRKSNEKGEHFRIDIDRYVEGPFDAGDAIAKLGSFADDIFKVFASAAGPALLEWMREKRP